MVKPGKPDNDETQSKLCDKPCSQELLREVMNGDVPADQYVERMLDHLERTK
ncbi:MAG: hypothetical protein AAFR68_03670 [Pseudomonadota bacterium]